MLFWWPVDLRLYAVTSQTTGAHLGRCSDSVKTILTAPGQTKASKDQAPLCHRRRRLKSRQGPDRVQPGTSAQDARPAGQDAEARAVPERRPGHDEPVPAR